MTYQAISNQQPNSVVVMEITLYCGKVHNQLPGKYMKKKDMVDWFKKLDVWLTF
jgi:hypothetical protein